MNFNGNDNGQSRLWEAFQNESSLTTTDIQYRLGINQPNKAVCALRKMGYDIIAQTRFKKGSDGVRFGVTTYTYRGRK